MVRLLLLCVAIVLTGSHATAQAQAGSPILVRTPAYAANGDQTGGVVELSLGADGQPVSVTPVSVAACSAPTPQAKVIETRVTWSLSVTPVRRAGDQVTAEVHWFVSDVQPKSTLQFPKRSATVQLSPGRAVNLDYFREGLPPGCQVLGHGLVLELKQPDQDDIVEADVVLMSERASGKQSLQAQSLRVRLNRHTEAIFDDLEIDTRQGRTRGRIIVGLTPLALQGDVVRATVEVTTLTAASSPAGRSASSTFDLKLAASENRALAVPLVPKDGANRLSVEVRLRKRR